MPRAVRTIARALVLAPLCVVLLAPTARAFHITPDGWCWGVDHPPFMDDYPPGGLSYGIGMVHFSDEAVALLELAFWLAGEGREVMVDARPLDSGLLWAPVPLQSYGQYVLKLADAEGHVYLEEPVTVDAGEPPCDPSQMRVPAGGGTAVDEPSDEPVPSREPEGEPSDAPEEEPEKEPTRVEAEPTVAVDGGGLPWELVLGGGLMLTAGGLLLARAPAGPCDEEKRRWQAAQDAERQARERAEQARQEAERAREQAAEATRAREQLDAELAELQRGTPGAGEPGGEESWVESEGRRIDGRDVRMGREAGRAAWERYRADPSPETAREAMEAWKHADTDEAREARREVDEQAQDVRRRRDEAAKAEREAKERAEQAREAADRAEQGASEAMDDTEAARRAYEACVGAASAPATGTATGTATAGGGEQPVSGGGTGVATAPGQGEQTRERPCPEGTEKVENVRTLGTVRMPVRMNVQFDGGEAHLAAEAGREIAGQLSEVSERLGWISLAMDIKGIGEKLVIDRSGVQALGASGAPLVSAKTEVPIPTSPAQAVVDYLRTVANIASVIINKVPELQERRLTDCAIRLSHTSRHLQVTCADLYRCENGQWVPAGQRFTVTVLRETTGYETPRTGLTWAQAQAEIAGGDRRFMNSLVAAIEQLEGLQRQCGGGS